MDPCFAKSAGIRAENMATEPIVETFQLQMQGGTQIPDHDPAQKMEREFAFTSEGGKLGAVTGDELLVVERIGERGEQRLAESTKVVIFTP